MSGQAITAPLIRRLEEISLNAWPAFRSLLHDGWLLAWAAGMSRRNNACHPLYPGTRPVADKIAAVEAFYENFEQPAIFKIHEAVEPGGLAARLLDAGYLAGETTLVLTLRFAPPVTGAPGPDAAVSVAPAPDPAWLALYGACLGVPDTTLPLCARVLETVAVEKRFFTLLEENQPVACGYGAREADWFGLYGVGVLPGRRGHGSGGRIVNAMLAWAETAGARQAYLQVMEHNAVARSLYEKLGFRESYRYRYFSKP